MYSFAVICWEVLTRSKPFDEIKNEVELVNEVHKGTRPPVAKLPSDVGSEVLSMIENCWSKDRSKRLTAIECKSVVERKHTALSGRKFDIFFSHKSQDKPMLSHVYNFLSRSGYKVWYDNNDIQIDLEPSMTEGILSSSVFVACVNSKYQAAHFCMFELKEAIRLNKPIICVVLDELPYLNGLVVTNGKSWVTPEFNQMCQFSTKMYSSLVDLAKLPWKKDEEPTQPMMIQLRDNLQFLVKLLKDSDCYPSLKHLKDAMYTAADLRGLGHSAIDLRRAGYTLGELVDAGYDILDLKDAGYAITELLDAQFTLTNIVAAKCYELGDFRKTKVSVYDLAQSYAYANIVLPCYQDNRFL
jgi:hypothetical protein